jgi:hypothetical protein
MESVEYRTINYRGRDVRVGSDGSIDGIKYLGVGTSGYMRTTRSLNGKLITLYVHRLVALAFHADTHTEEHCQVDHINGIRTDNRAVNIRWVTRSENHKNRARLRCRRVMIVHIMTGEQHVFYGLKPAGRFLHAGEPTLKKHDASRQPLHGSWIVDILPPLTSYRDEKG